MSDLFERAKEPSDLARACRVRVVVEALRRDDHAYLEDFRSWLRGEAQEVSIAGIARALTAAGYPLNRQTLGRHTRRDCSCPGLD